MRIIPFFLLVAISLFTSCTNPKPKTDGRKAADSLRVEYANGFAIRYFDEYKEVIVYSPWIKGTVYARYFLVKDVHTQTPADGTKVQIPLKTNAATSVTHFEFLSLLGELQTISGVCSPGFIYNNKILKR
jgi:iron complex transport system substrate-binding protein